MNRAECLHEIAVVIESAAHGQPLLVAIDGIDASGKTTLADDLVMPVKQLGFGVIRASIDGFHQPQAIRRQRGTLSPEGYYEDAFDYKALRNDLLEPLSNGGSCLYRTQAFDFLADQPIDGGWQKAGTNTVLLVDGVFLQRPEINHYWDMRVWVDIPFELALQRALTRDLDLFGSVEVVRQRYAQRYIPGQLLYIAQCQPKQHALLIVENSDPLHPILFRNS